MVMLMVVVVVIMMLMVVAMVVVVVEMMMLLVLVVLVLVMMLVVKVVVKVMVEVVTVMMVFVMINAVNQSPIGRFRGITFDYPKGFHKISYPLAVDIAHYMLNRLYVSPPPPPDPPLNPGKKLCQPDKQPTGDQRAQVASRG
ncbi:hypothetical protein DPMN_015915 [Dreissena polymorpha]|uniref:Uncharacterized protein n=1 Tax=Dreissena polymorpha TaxID=45954 RepID=A0A9D4NEK0_DREPO|nr:hypothetical protein DPMN_015915 [Dreissena polymorpha]